MLADITRYISGYMTVRIKGSEKARFINLAVRQGVRFWGYSGTPEVEEYSVRTKLTSRQKLEELAAKMGIELHFEDRRGLPVRLKLLRNHPGILAGIITAVILLTALSDNIWVLTSSGSQVYSDEEIFEAAEEVGVYFGADLDSYDAISAARLMLLSLPKLSWISINDDGVFVDIAVQDKIEAPELTEDTGISNIVAKKSGIIRLVEAENGVPVVTDGDIVKPGDMCISGIWDDDKGHTFTAASRGKVWAEVPQNFYIAVPRRTVKYNELSNTVKRRLRLFSLDLPLSLAAVSYNSYSVKETEYPLELLGTELPISVTETVYTSLEPWYEFLSDSQCEALALEKLSQYQQTYLGGEGKVISERNTVFSDELGYYLFSECIFLENIAEMEYVLVE